MNSLKGRILSVQSTGNLSLVTLDVDGIELKSVVLENRETASYLIEGRPINILFKETEVVIATGDVTGISLQNRLAGTVLSVERGELISKVTVNTPVGEVAAVITTPAVDRLLLEPGKPVTALVKTNEILLSE